MRSGCYCGSAYIGGRKVLGLDPVGACLERKDSPPSVKVSPQWLRIRHQVTKVKVPMSYKTFGIFCWLIGSFMRLLRLADTKVT